MEAKSKAREKFESEIQLAWNAMYRRATKAAGKNEADDIVMGAYAEVLSKLNWEEVREPRKWMLGVIDNHILRWQDQRRTECSRCVQLWHGESEIDLLPDFAPDLIDALAKEQEISESMEEIMRWAGQAKLNSREDYVFVQRANGMLYQDIAQTLGISPPACRAYMSHAVAKIIKARAAESVKSVESVESVESTDGILEEIK